MSYSMQEKFGIIDLLQTNKQNIPILFQLAKSVTRNVIDVETEQEALNAIFLHIPDTPALLNKRIITKEVICKYLHTKRVPLTGDCTKSQLIKNIVNYWYQVYAKYQTTNKTTEITNSSINNEHNKTFSGHTSPDSKPTILQETSHEFPIHLLARQFSEWFFNNYNKNNLKLVDFWSDVTLMLEVTANDGIDEQNCGNSHSVLQSLLETRQRFGFYFNPNLTHAGVQGRMDVHGLVLVLACGTLHAEFDCVGVFECIFGLLRDPFAENNWKTKNIKLTLRSKRAPAMPSLEDSMTLKDALALSVPHEELT